MSHTNAGKADIEEEIFSEDNQQFVLHDSQGFEAGEEDNLKIVRDFIDKRNRMPDIKDKLHAIWYALAFWCCHLTNDCPQVVLRDPDCRRPYLRNWRRRIPQVEGHGEARHKYVILQYLSCSK